MQQTVIEVSDLHKTYDRQPVLSGVSFDVDLGEIFGIAGRNGAGKTTTVEILQGLRGRDRGQVVVLGLDPGRQRKRLRPLVGSQLQTSALPERIRVGEALGLAAELLGARLPPGAPVVAPPGWLREAVLRGWVRGYDSMPPPLYELHTLGFRGAMRAMRARWPDPVSATVHLRAPFRRIPRVLVQTAECLRRAFDFVRRDVRWRVGIDAQLANVGKGVVP